MPSRHCRLTILKVTQLSYEFKLSEHLQDLVCINVSGTTFRTTYANLDKHPIRDSRTLYTSHFFEHYFFVLLGIPAIDNVAW